MRDCCEKVSIVDDPVLMEDIEFARDIKSSQEVQDRGRPIPVRRENRFTSLSSGLSIIG